MGTIKKACLPLYKLYFDFTGFNSLELDLLLGLGVCLASSRSPRPRDQRVLIDLPIGTGQEFGTRIRDGFRRGE
jgi:hypothetical protein